MKDKPSDFKANDFVADDFWLAKPVPRYTSYPPAPAFSDAVGAREYARVLSTLSPDEVLSLYIHVPFCRHLCLYCGCHTSVTQREDRLKTYLSAVKSEMRAVASLMGLHKRKMSHLHFGGGSPNILSPAMLTDLFAEIHNLFDLSDNPEVAMEIDPRLVTLEQIKNLAQCGVTRVSLGVQDFNVDVQTAVNRIQPFEMVRDACVALRENGIKRINFDLMYGLPLQSPETLQKSTELAVSLNPDRVAYFSYAHVPQIKPQQRELEKYGLPDKYELLAQEQAGRSVLEKIYHPIGMDHYAKEDDALFLAMKCGKLHRNFQGYTDDAAKTLLGFGASSIGQTDGHFFQNEKDVSLYENTFLSEKDMPALATVRGYSLSQEDKLRSAVIEKLMCDMSVDLNEVSAEFGCEASFFAAEVDMLKQFEAAGIVNINEAQISLSINRRMAIRVVAHVFDKYAALPKVASKAA